MTSKKDKSPHCLTLQKKRSDFLKMLSLEKEIKNIAAKIKIKQQLIDILSNRKEYNTSGFF